MPSLNLQYPLHPLIVNLSESKLFALHLTLSTNSLNISNWHIFPTMYECQAVLCTCAIVSLYSLRVHSMRCCYLSSDRPTAFAIQPLLLILRTPLALFQSKLDSEPTALRLRQSAIIYCSEKYLSSSWSKLILVWTFRSQIWENDFFNRSYNERRSSQRPYTSYGLRLFWRRPFQEYI